MGYRFGMDIGIASCGWSVVDIDNGRIVDMGVRIFEKAENPKTGESLNLPRRTARGQRRRLRRRSYRIEDIRDLFVEQGMFSSTEDLLDELSMVREFDHSVWDLRVKGLEHKLTAIEWARVLIRIAKRRGYQSNRRLEAGETEDTKAEERGVVLQKIQSLRMHQEQGSFRTIGETLAKHESYQEYKRNRHGKHRFHINRSMLVEEVDLLFEAQRRDGNPYATEAFQQQYRKLAFDQRPFATRELLERKIGYCTFVKTDKRSPKFSRSSELFVMLQKINHLRLIEAGAERGLTDEERQLLIEHAHDQKELKYTSVRRLLKLSDTQKFKGLTYGGISIKSLNEAESETEKTKPVKKAKNPEDTRFVQLKFYHVVKDALAEHAQLDWEMLLQDRKSFDQLGDVLTLCKNEYEMERDLNILGLSEQAKQACVGLSFSGYGHLSNAAYDRIIPFLEEGLTYDKACEAAGFDFRDQTHEKQKFLKVIDPEEIRNPVVLRALTQSRKVINAMIREYGTPGAVHIEVAREMSKPYEERKNIKKMIESNRAEKDKVVEFMKKEFPMFRNRDPKAFDVLKYKLYREQHGKCLYSGLAIDLNRIFGEDGYVEVDHILPMSRTMDDSYMNKVLVLQKENRNKRNQTPFEWFGRDAKRWAEFEAIIKVVPYKKQLNLLRKSLGEEQTKDFMSRNLNDTRYIARFFSKFVRDHLIIESGKVVCVNGQLTAFLRTRFGLGNLKDRSEDIHHAVDAVMIAIANEAMMKRASEFHKRKELYGVKAGDHFVDRETGEILDDRYCHVDRDEKFPLPWNDFRFEVLCRLGIDPHEKRSDLPDESDLRRIHDPKELLEKYSLNAYVGLTEKEWRWVRPMFVSRAPRRNVTGKAHQDTIKGLRTLEEVEVKVKKTSLASLVGNSKKTMGRDEVDKIINTIFGEDPNMKKAVRDWLLYTPNLQEAIKNEDFPRKTAKNGLGPMIRSVKIIESSLSGVRLNGGKAIAENDAMVRIDIFEKAGKYYAVPIYVADTVKIELPNRAALAHKPETEWDIMDENYRFCFTLYPNDLVKLEVRGSKYFGYFGGFDRSTALLEILSHDRSGGKDGKYRGLGFKLGVIKFQKYVIDPIGYYYPVKGEKRLGFSQC